MDPSLSKDTQLGSSSGDSDLSQILWIKTKISSYIKSIISLRKMMERSAAVKKRRGKFG